MKQGRLVPGGDRPIVTSGLMERCDEAAVVSNPSDASNVIAAFGNYTGGEWNRSLAVYSSADGGRTWSPAALPSVSESARIPFRSPVLTFAPDGTAYLVAYSPVLLTSLDQGRTWDATPAPWAPSASPIAFACHPVRRHELYAAWWHLDLAGVRGGTPAIFARSLDAGKTWTRLELRDEAELPVESLLAPHLQVDGSGTIHLVSFAADGRLRHWRSVDDGTTFVVRRVAERRDTRSIFHTNSGVTACLSGGARLVVAWPTVRDGISSIYYRMTDDTGAEWLGPSEGTPLLTGRTPGRGLQHLRPRLAAVPGEDVIGCAFYELRSENGIQRADLMISASINGGADFIEPVPVSDVSWSPTLDGGSFGRYFGFGAERGTFSVVWPDDRSGTPTLYFDRVQIQIVERNLPEGWDSDEIVIYRDSERWYVITRRWLRDGRILDILRIPPRPVPPSPGAAPLLDASEVFGAETRRHAVEDPRILREVGRALDAISDVLATDGQHVSA